MTDTLWSISKHVKYMNISRHTVDHQPIASLSTVNQREQVDQRFLTVYGLKFLSILV